jgi:hypothetical protein
MFFGKERLGQIEEELHQEPISRGSDHRPH